MLFCPKEGSQKFTKQRRRILSIDSHFANLDIKPIFIPDLNPLT